MAKNKKKPADYPASSQSAQEDAIERFRSLLSADEFSHLLAELDKPLYPAFRVNLLKARREDALLWAQRYGWTLSPVPYCDSGWWVTSARVPVSQTLEHRFGAYYMQDAASMLPVELFDFDGLTAPLVLDMAASPGGKTTHLINRTADRGLVMANDLSASRITALRLVLQGWGATNQIVTRFPGESFGAWFPETFDRVLLDAPCSMQNLRSTDSHPMRPISDKERSSLALRQTRLLESAVQALKVGGQVVYSTCTLSPEEDEGVLDALVKRYGTAVRIENTAERLPYPAPGLTTYGEIAFNPAVSGSARFWPHRYGTSGFFAALITKSESVDHETDPPPMRPFAKTGLERLSMDERSQLFAELWSLYGFDLKSVLEQQGLELWRRGQTTFALPLIYLNQFSSLPFQTIGLALGENMPEGFAPSHEWVTRFAGRFLAGRYRLATEQVAAWLRGEDLRSAPVADYPRGRLVVVEDEQGNYLGRGKILEDRVKNLLPRRLAFSVV